MERIVSFDFVSQKAESLKWNFRAVFVVLVLLDRYSSSFCFDLFQKRKETLFFCFLIHPGSRQYTSSWASSGNILHKIVWI